MAKQVTMSHNKRMQSDAEKPAPLMRGVMCFNMNRELEDLRKTFEEYYSTEYSEEDDTLENTKIRKRAVEIIAVALKKKDVEYAEQVLNLLSENTGCAEDLIIFEELIKPLAEAHEITQEQIDVVLNAKAITRWR